MGVQVVSCLTLFPFPAFLPHSLALSLSLPLYSRERTTRGNRDLSAIYPDE